jgi:glycosyl transferase family 25
MRVFLINLDRRPDRLAAMKTQLDRLGIAFERFSATDAARMDPAELNAPFADDGPLGALSPGDKGCTYSHLRVWQTIAAGPDEYAAVLEDDIRLSESAPEFLTGSGWIPPGIDLVKPERYGDENQLIVIGKPRIPVKGRILAPLLSRHTGTGGYIISRELAASLAGTRDKIALPVDHLLFNPNNSPIFDRLKPWQLLPAIFDQRVEVGGATDIHRTRQAAKPRGIALVRRQLRRNYYDLRLVPRHVMQVVSGRAKVVKIALR